MVANNPVPQKPGPAPYAGPRDSDPLTEDELSLLLAIPRAARASPDATLFRLPRGNDPSMGWVDVTCAETFSIVSRLAAQWDAKLSGILHHQTQGAISKVGPGTTICMVSRSSVFGLFHFLAFWSLGCTIQYLNATLDGPAADYNLALSGCKVVIHSGMSESWVQERGERLNGEMVELPKNEYAHQLVETERQKIVKPPPVWPTPRRPTPAFIIQSSGTSGMPKPLEFSLYYHTIGLKFSCQSHLAFANSQHSDLKTIYTHPRLMINPPYWQSFYPNFFVHLLTATPLAFAAVSEPLNQLSSRDLIAWVKGLDAGGTISSTYSIREILVDGTHDQVLKDMYSFSFSGFTVDEQTSRLFEKSGLPLTNIFGSSEFNRALYASSAPYNLLRPFPDLPPPLVNPLTERRSDGSREVELWYSASSSPWFAHLLVQGGVPLNIEPFPGEGSHHGEPAINSKDIFREVITGPSNETGYIHLGRADDRIWARGGAKRLIASAYEARLRASVECSEGLGGWRVDAVQVFGGTLPAMALVIQLHAPSGEGSSVQKSSKRLEPEVIATLARCIEGVNVEMNLEAFRVSPEKRLLVITTDGEVHGPGMDRLIGFDGGKSIPRLMLTHKHTLQRWVNVRAFGPWLEGLDYSEP